MNTPLVSIIILNYFHPEVVNICLRSIEITEGIPYEVVVVDNGSSPDVVEALVQHRNEGRITTLVPEPVNHMFAEGNNIGVRNSHPDSKYLLLLNSDVAFLRPDWLTKLVAWMEGTIEYTPSIWGLHPAQPHAGPRDIVSAGFSYDPNVLPGRMRPEGFCCMIRRSVWRDISTDFPWHYGLEEAIALSIRDGAKCGVLSQYPTYFVHREGGSAPGTWTCETQFEKAPVPIINLRTPDLPAWFDGLEIETLDFSLGDHEHDSYLAW